MKIKTKLSAVFVALFAMVFMVACEEASTQPEDMGTSSVRVIHTSYDAPAVDIKVDGVNAVTDLAYGESSGYAEVESGMRNVIVTPTGQASPEVIDADLPVDENKEYTVLAVEPLNTIGAIFTEDNRSPVSGSAKVRFIHASPDAPAVDIKVGTGDGTAVFTDVGFKDIETFVEVAPGDYSFVVTATGSTDEVVAYEPATLEEGQVYTVVAHGTLNSGDQYPFGVRVFIDTGNGDQYADLSEASNTSNVRVIHTSYDAPAVDIALDGTTAIMDLAYGESSGYAEVEAGTRNAVVTPAGQSSPEVINANIPLMRGSDYTVFAVDAVANIEPVFVEDMREPATSMAKIRFLHAAPDAPAVDIKIGSGDGTVAFSNAAFKDIADYIQVDPGNYSFVVTPAGATTELIVFDPVEVQAGMVYTVVAHGTYDDSDNYPFGVRVFVDNNPGDAYVDLTAATSSAMVIHASPDAPGVDLYINNVLINTDAAVEYPDNTGYLSLTSGTRNVKVNATGTETTVIDADVTFQMESSYSIFAVNELASIEPLVVVDDLTPPASGNAHVRFLHLSPDAPAVDITTDAGDIVFGDYSFKDYSDFTPLTAGEYDLQVRAQGTETVVLDLDPITVEDGKIYTIFAKGFLEGTGDEALGAEIIVNN